MLCASIGSINKLCNLLFIFSSLASKKKKRTKKEETAINFCAAYGIALVEWTFVPFASQTKSLSAAKTTQRIYSFPYLGKAGMGSYFYRDINLLNSNLSYAINSTAYVILTKENVTTKLYVILSVSEGSLFA